MFERLWAVSAGDGLGHTPAYLQHAPRIFTRHRRRTTRTFTSRQSTQGCARSMRVHAVNTHLHAPSWRQRTRRGPRPLTHQRRTWPAAGSSHRCKSPSAAAGGKGERAAVSSVGRRHISAGCSTQGWGCMRAHGPETITFSRQCLHIKKGHSAPLPPRAPWGTGGGATPRMACSTLITCITCNMQCLHGHGNKGHSAPRSPRGPWGTAGGAARRS